MTEKCFVVYFSRESKIYWNRTGTRADFDSDLELLRPGLDPISMPRPASVLCQLALPTFAPPVNVLAST